MKCVTDDPRLDLTIGFPRRAAGASSTARHVVDDGRFVNGTPFAPLMEEITVSRWSAERRRARELK